MPVWVWRSRLLSPSREDLRRVVWRLHASHPVVMNGPRDALCIEGRLTASSSIEVPMTRALVSTACLAIFCVVSTCGALVDSAEKKVRVHSLDYVFVRKRRRLLRRVRRRYRVRRRRTVDREALCESRWSESSRGTAYPAGPAH